MGMEAKEKCSHMFRREINCYLRAHKSQMKANYASPP